MTEVEKEFNKFGEFVVNEGRKILTEKDHRATSSLYNSLRYEFKQSKNSIQWDFYAEDYADFVDKGVKGVTSGFRSPDSPYKFGTGSGETEGLTRGINNWVRVKRIQFRKPNGKFLSYEETANKIIRSVWNKGLEATKFLTVPFTKAFNNMPDKIAEAYGLDAEYFIKKINI